MQLVLPVVGSSPGDLRHFRNPLLWRLWYLPPLGIKRRRCSCCHYVAVPVRRTIDIAQVKSSARRVEDQCTAIVRDPLSAQVGKLNRHSIVLGIPGLDVPGNEEIVRFALFLGIYQELGGPGTFSVGVFLIYPKRDNFVIGCTVRSDSRDDIRYRPRPDATPEAERSALAAVYCYLLGCRARKENIHCEEEIANEERRLQLRRSVSRWKARKLRDVASISRMLVAQSSAR
jgi:hypothetical protein